MLQIHSFHLTCRNTSALCSPHPTSDGGICLMPLIKEKGLLGCHTGERLCAPTSASDVWGTEQLAFPAQPCPQISEAQHIDRELPLAELSLVLCFWNGKWLIPTRMLAFSVPYWLALAVSSTTPGWYPSMCPIEPWSKYNGSALKFSGNSFPTLSLPHNKSHPLLIWPLHTAAYLKF